VWMNRKDTGNGESVRQGTDAEGGLVECGTVAFQGGLAEIGLLGQYRVRRGFGRVRVSRLGSLVLGGAVRCKKWMST
jgi:hypothetical protein